MTKVKITLEAELTEEMSKMFLGKENKLIEILRSGYLYGLFEHSYLLQHKKDTNLDLSKEKEIDKAILKNRIKIALGKALDKTIKVEFIY